MADFLIPSLRGGLNEDPPTSLADDQCTVARNVEYWISMLGERRLGGLQLSDLASSPLKDCVAVTWLHRHLPTADPRDAQLWALGLTAFPGSPGFGAVLAYKDTAWHQVLMPDPLTPEIGPEPWEIQGQSFNTKLFIAYRSNVDRLHVWEPGATALRRVGLAVPVVGISSLAEFGAGSFTGNRYYRPRWVARTGTTVNRRSEPGPPTTAAPTGTAEGINVLVNTTLFEGDNAWDLEASVDGLNYYRIGTADIGSTIADTTNYAEGYAQHFPLSEESGANEPWPAVKLLTVDQNRLMGAHLWYRTASYRSTVIWSAVLNDPGAGNDERIPLSTNNALGLDANEGGPLTCLSATINGYIYATKASAIYQLSRTGMRAHAYDAICLTKQRGALYGSLMEAFDQTGQPSMFGLDPHVGAFHIGARGVEPCGRDICRTWATVNLNYTAGIARGLYYPLKKQIHWRLATGTGFVHVVLHTQEMRQTPSGLRGGWTVWDGVSAEAGAWCLFSDNINDNAPRNNILRPFLGFNGHGLIWQMEQGDTDNGTPYHAAVVTKPFVHASLLNQFEVHSGMLLASAIPGGVLDVTLRGDFGLVQTTTRQVLLDPVGSEPRVIKNLDDLGLAEVRALQIVFEDSTEISRTSSGVTRWSLEQFAIRELGGAKA